MSKIKDYLLDLEEVSINDYPEGERKEISETKHIPEERECADKPF